MTEVNKRQYVHCLAKYLMVDRVAKQVEAFMEGEHLFVICRVSKDAGIETSGKDLYCISLELDCHKRICGLIPNEKVLYVSFD